MQVSVEILLAMVASPLIFQNPRIAAAKRAAPELIGRCSWKGAEVPINGTGEAYTAGYDKAMSDYLREVGGTGGSLVVFYQGKKVYAKGFGYANLDEKVPFTPQTPTRISSLSKYLTKRSINLLIEQGKIEPSSKAIDILRRGGVVPLTPKGTKVDPRVESITIQNLLDHKSGIEPGLDISQCMSAEVIKMMGFQSPITQNDALGYVLGLPLNSDPGSTELYSNFGFALLGKIVQIVSGQSYESFVKSRVLDTHVDPSPWFTTTAQRKDKHPDEAEYYSWGQHRTWDSFRWDICAGAGGWVAPVNGIAEFFSKEFPGLGYDYTLFGSYTGAVTVMKVHLNSLTFAASINFRRGNDASDNDVLFSKLEKVTAGLKLP